MVFRALSPAGQACLCNPVACRLPGVRFLCVVSESAASDQSLNYHNLAHTVHSTALRLT